MADLAVNIGEFRFENPVTAASGTFAYGVEYEPFVDLSRIGGIFTKGLSPKPRPGNDPPRLCETASGLLNAIGLQNIGVDAFCAEKLPRLRELRAKVFVNVFGDEVEDYWRVVERLEEEEEGVHGYELNLSCPNVKDGGIAFGTDPALIRRITLGVRRRTARLVIVKLTPQVTDIALMARAAKEGGADAVSAINTLPAMAVDLDSRRPVLANLTGGLSGPAIKPVALCLVWKIHSQVEIPIIGIGGISSGRDALEFMVAGASVIQVGSENFRDPAATLRILEEMNDGLDRLGIASAREIVGSLKVPGA